MNIRYRNTRLQEHLLERQPGRLHRVVSSIVASGLTSSLNSGGLRRDLR